MSTRRAHVAFVSLTALFAMTSLVNAADKSGGAHSDADFPLASRSQAHDANSGCPPLLYPVFETSPPAFENLSDSERQTLYRYIVWQMHGDLFWTDDPDYARQAAPRDLHPRSRVARALRSRIASLDPESRRRLLNEDGTPQYRKNEHWKVILGELRRPTDSFLAKLVATRTREQLLNLLLRSGWSEVDQDQFSSLYWKLPRDLGLRSFNRTGMTITLAMTAPIVQRDLLELGIAIEKGQSSFVERSALPAHIASHRWPTEIANALRENLGRLVDSHVIETKTNIELSSTSAVLGEIVRFIVDTDQIALVIAIDFPRGSLSGGYRPYQPSDEQMRKLLQVLIDRQGLAEISNGPGA
ncbi:MAG: hypothetical protein AB7G93_20545 [Bdellovibrionales bacterium]